MTQSSIQWILSLNRLSHFWGQVQVLMSGEMKDQVDALARELQRAKTSKDERITSNTVIRVAIRHFLDEFKLPKSEQPNTEEELLALAKRRRT